MNLEFRPLRPADFDQCATIMHDRFAYDAAQLEAIEKFWLDILNRGLGSGAVVFHPNERERVLAFGIHCYVTSVTAAALIDYNEPLLARSMLDLWRSGTTPFLLEGGVARDNAGAGVNVFVSHAGFAAPFTDAVAGAVIPSLVEGFVASVRGLNIRIIIQEMFGFSRDLAIGMGVKIRELPPGRVWKHDAIAKPFLITLSREQVRPEEVNILGLSLFGEFEPPRLHFSRAHRDLLRAAIIRDNDPWIAGILNVSLSAVKKRWQSIFDVMGERCPDVFPRGVVLGDGQRGAEKRGHVLLYVRHHPEELHPYSLDNNSDTR